MKLKIPIVATLILLLFSGQSIALDFGTNITVYDRESTTAGWYGQQEDQEVEPGNVQNQIWDLEGFFQKGNELAIVSGYNLKDGQNGWDSGHIFIDIDNDAQYGDMLPEYRGDSGPDPVTNIYGYDYVVDINWSAETFDLYRIDSDTVLTTYYNSNNRANPWRYESGGDPFGTTKTFDYDNTLSDSDTGFLGGTHYAAVFDLSELFNDIGSNSDFLAHFTMECGNDNLIGAVPEPSTMVISGFFLLGAGFFVRRKLHGES